MAFTVFIACDVGDSKLNTGIEFPARPSTLADLVRVAEALYTAELQLHRGDRAARFVCAAVMLLRGGLSGEDGAWEEVLDVAPVPHMAQLFAFDKASAYASRGAIPKAQFVVTARQVMAAAEQQQLSGAAGGPSPPERRAASPQSASGVVNTPPAHHPQQHRSMHIPPAASSDPRSRSEGTQLPADAREYLFEQLCRASGSADAVSTQRLHAIFVDNGLVFSTEAFSTLVRGQFQLDRRAWAVVEADYAPVVDALYDRIATKTAAHRDLLSQPAPVDMSGARRELQALEDEEARLLARHAAVRQRVGELQRAVREEEARVEALDPNAGEDRAREWDTLQKFVLLRMRQAKLRDEEEQVNHQLSLL
jgi:hypothetical protein